MTPKKNQIIISTLIISTILSASALLFTQKTQAAGSIDITFSTQGCTNNAIQTIANWARDPAQTHLTVYEDGNLRQTISISPDQGSAILTLAGSKSYKLQVISINDPNPIHEGSATSPSCQQEQPVPTPTPTPPEQTQPPNLAKPINLQENQYCEPNPDDKPVIVGFSWSASSTIKSYRVFVEDKSDPSKKLLPGQLVTETADTWLDFPGDGSTQTWLVRAYATEDGNENAGVADSDKKNFKTRTNCQAQTPPAIPTGLGSRASCNDGGENTITLYWNNVDGATGYTVHLDGDAGQSTQLDVTGTAVQVPPPPPNAQRYAWRVKSYKSVNGQKYESEFTTYHPITPQIIDCQPKPSPTPTPTVKECVTISWEPFAVGGPYHVHFDQADQDIQKTTNDTTYTFTDQARGTYDYAIHDRDHQTEVKGEVQSGSCAQPTPAPTATPKPTPTPKPTAAPTTQPTPTPTPQESPTPPGSTCQNPGSFKLVSPQSETDTQFATFRWDPSEGASRYFLQLSEDSFETYWDIPVSPDSTEQLNGKTLVYQPWPSSWGTNFSNGKVAPSKLEAQKTYSARVLAIGQCFNQENIQSSNYSAIISFIYVAPEGPRQITPAVLSHVTDNDQISNNFEGIDVKFSWTPKQDLLEFDQQWLYLKFSPGEPNHNNSVNIGPFDRNVFSTEVKGDLDFPGLIPQTEYIWTIDTIDLRVSYQASLANPDTFKTIGASQPPDETTDPKSPTKPTLTQPENGANLPNNDFSFNWSGQPNANYYWIDIATDDKFQKWFGCQTQDVTVWWQNCQWDSFVQGPGGVDLGDDPIPAQGLPDGQYYWKVTAQNDFGKATSQTSSFTIGKKQPEIIPDALPELTCNTNWKTIKAFGNQFTPESIASYNGRLVISGIDNSRSDPHVQSLLAWEINPDANLDTGPYQTGFNDSQNSHVLIIQNGKLMIYVYGNVFGGNNRTVFKGEYLGEKSWGNFANTNSLNLGITGPHTTSFGNKIYQASWWQGGNVLQVCETTTVPSPTPIPTPSPSSTPSPQATSSATPTSTPEPICQLEDASWSTDITNEGRTVNLNLKGSIECHGKQISFKVFENDSAAEGFGDDNAKVQPQNTTFNGPNAQTSWVAEYVPDGPNGLFDPPEYYFTAYVGTNPTLTIKSSSPNLAVYQSCEITSASWNSANAQAGQIVSLEVKGNYACFDQEVSLIVKENDSVLEGGIDDEVAQQPQKIKFPKNLVLDPRSGPLPTTISAFGTWTAEYQQDGLLGTFDPPEYYFLAQIVGSDKTTRSTGPLLNVNATATNQNTQNTNVPNTGSTTPPTSQQSTTTPTPRPASAGITGGVSQTLTNLIRSARKIVGLSPKPSTKPPSSIFPTSATESAIVAPPFEATPQTGTPEQITDPTPSPKQEPCTPENLKLNLCDIPRQVQPQEVKKPNFFVRIFRFFTSLFK